MFRYVPLCGHVLIVHIERCGKNILCMRPGKEKGKGNLCLGVAEDALNPEGCWPTWGAMREQWINIGQIWMIDRHVRCVL